MDGLNINTTSSAKKKSINSNSNNGLTNGSNSTTKSSKIKDKSKINKKKARGRPKCIKKWWIYGGSFRVLSTAAYFTYNMYVLFFCHDYDKWKCVYIKNNDLFIHITLNFFHTRQYTIWKITSCITSIKKNQTVECFV